MVMVGKPEVLGSPGLVQSVSDIFLPELLVLLTFFRSFIPAGI